MGAQRARRLMLGAMAAFGSAAGLTVGWLAHVGGAAPAGAAITGASAFAIALSTCLQAANYLAAARRAELSGRHDGCNRTAE